MPQKSLYIIGKCCVPTSDGVGDTGRLMSRLSFRNHALLEPQLFIPSKEKPNNFLATDLFACFVSII